MVNAQIAVLFTILLAAVVPAVSILTICRVAAVRVGVLFAAMLAAAMQFVPIIYHASNR